MEVDSPIGEQRKRKIEDSSEGKEYYPQVGFVLDAKVIKDMNKIAPITNRAVLVHSLINVYDLLRNMTIYSSKPATDWDLSNFHSCDFIDFMKSIDDCDDFPEELELDYGLGYDCPPIERIYDFICSIAGSSLTAARALKRREVEVAINWNGGWHHAQRDEVEGFCYVNDIVIAIIDLRFKFEKILYIDLDVHHGDGVERCFAYSDKVMTVSLHQYEAGFFPGSGSLSDVGHSRGLYYTVNVPLKEGITDVPYCRVFDGVLEAVVENFQADAVVVQCGADALGGDPIGGFNLTPRAFGHCLKAIIDLQKPTLVLGGGGYNIVNTAKCWTYLTSVVIGCDLPNDIPEHQNLMQYGPDYVLEVCATNRKDMNSPEELNSIVETVRGNLRKIVRS